MLPSPCHSYFFIATISSLLFTCRFCQALFLIYFFWHCQFKFQCITSEDFRRHFLGCFQEKLEKSVLDSIDWNSWFYKPGQLFLLICSFLSPPSLFPSLTRSLFLYHTCFLLSSCAFLLSLTLSLTLIFCLAVGLPVVIPQFDQSLANASQALCDKWVKEGASNDTTGAPSASDLSGWSTDQIGTYLIPLPFCLLHVLLFYMIVSFSLSIASLHRFILYLLCYCYCCCYCCSCC